MLKRKIATLPSTELPIDGRDFSIRNCVKDLRLRRVFSLGSDPKDIGSTENGHCKDPIEDPEISEKGNKADLADVLDKGPICTDVTNKNGCTPKGILKRPNGSDCDIYPTRLTPPENIINVDLKGNQINSSQNSFNKTKPRIAPSRLVRVPNSLSYRRLLPYLTEIDKNEKKTKNVNSLKSNENPNFSANSIPEIPKLEIQKPNCILNSDSVEIPNFDERPNFEIPKSEIKKPNSISKLDSIIPELSEIPDLAKTPNIEIPKLQNTNPNPTSILDPINHPLSKIPNFVETPNIEITKSQNTNPYSISILDPINPPLSKIPNSAETPNFEIPQSPNPNLTNSIKAQQTINDSICIPSLSPLSLSSTPETLTLTSEEITGGNFSKSEIGISPKRAIIKRDNNKRGCKGICSCLDCVSFKIHAEKTFEFSKKQMYEADDIIGGLVKELSTFKQLIEKSSENITSDKTQTYQNELLKIACQRASIAEKIATSRVKQMFLDLNAHCKIPGPKVAFSDCIEQRIVPASHEDRV